MRRFYCVLYEDDKKIFDVIGPISDDTLFTESVCKAQKRGLNVSCSTVDKSDVKSIDELKRDGDPPGYKYCSGLIKKLGIEY